MYIFSLQVQSFKQVTSLTEHFLPILLAFYIGSWSDKFGRKIFIAVNLGGQTIARTGSLLAGIYQDQINKWVWMGLYMPAYSLTGGWMALVLVTYSFIADNSSTRFTFYNTNKKDIPPAYHYIFFIKLFLFF